MLLTVRQYIVSRRAGVRYSPFRSGSNTLPDIRSHTRLNFIIRHPVLTAKSDSELAARSGALFMLVRSSNWKPQQGENIRYALINDTGDEYHLFASLVLLDLESNGASRFI